jgi:rhamnosyltransferase
MIVQEELYDLSIIIPFKDEYSMLLDLLNSINNQKTLYSFEIIILDSSNLDCYKKDFIYIKNIQWVKIDPLSFNHGYSRNLGVRFSKGEYIIFTVQDAIPTDSNWIEVSMNGIIKNNLDACCGRQIVLHKKSNNPVEWSRPFDEPCLSIVNITPERFIELPAQKKRELTGWDNVNSIYRKSVLIQLPFKKIAFGEDAQWAFDALCYGYKIGYNGHSIVEHYHFYDLDFAIKRNFAHFFVMKKVYNLDPIKPRISLKQILNLLKLLLISRLAPLKILFWSKYNFRLIRSTFLAYKLWYKFIDINEIEHFLLINPPLSRRLNRKSDE